MTLSPVSARCFNHASRPAFALCVSCGKAICQSCATLWDGRYFCVDCLAQQRAAAGRRRAILRSLATAATGAALLLFATFLRAWLGALLAEVF